MSNPDVSIIITNYNYGKFLARSIRSCISQRNVKNEVIVVDDCSTDNSLEVLEPFKKDITIIENKKNLGVAGSSNAGIKAAKGQFVIRVDADDFVRSYALKRISKDLALRTYSSRLLGSDPNLVLHGGGNTSVKTSIRDIDGKNYDVLCVKGSGWDMAEIEPAGLPAVK